MGRFCRPRPLSSIDVVLVCSVQAIYLNINVLISNLAFIERTCPGSLMSMTYTYKSTIIGIFKCKKILYEKCLAYLWLALL